VIIVIIFMKYKAQMSTARAPSSFSDSVLIQRYNAVAVFCIVRPHKPRG